MSGKKYGKWDYLCRVFKREYRTHVWMPILENKTSLEINGYPNSYHIAFCFEEVFEKNTLVTVMKNI
jgi:hypothetical protein